MGADVSSLQLSRGKDPNKSSKKNKDSKDGTSSPSSIGGASRDSSNQSPVLTPSSSASNLSDIRNKPLPPNNAALGGDHGGGAPGQPPHLGSAGAASNLGVPDRFSSMPEKTANGASTPARHGGLPPTVIISPSAPVRCPRGSSTVLPSADTKPAYPAAGRRRNHAPRSRAPQGRPEVADV